MNPKSILEKNLTLSIESKNIFLQDKENLNSFKSAVENLLETYKGGGRLFLAGNGGSAADSQHIAAEFVSRLVYDRPALPAEALTVDTSALTAIAKKAIKRKTGARGLRSIMEIALLETMYDIPGQDNLEEVIISAEVIEGTGEPLLVYKKEEKAAPKKAAKSLA